ncbi:MAG: STAS domain-containing protein [Planctomycetota bacterium]
MKTTIEQFDELAVVQLEGEFTLDDADRFRRETLAQMEEKARDFVLDLKGVEFMDSTALETLLWLQDQSAQRLGQVRLAELSENVAAILRLTRLDKRFDTHTDVESAVKSLR